MNKYLLFEIGTEEMPSRFMGDALNQLKEGARKCLIENRVTFDDIKIYGTPRRLTLLIENLSDKQSDLEEELKGPSKKIAFDENNNPTRPLEGFMKSKGLTVNDLYYKTIGKEEYVFSKLNQQGKDVIGIIPQILETALRSISFPKSMRWGGKNLKFPRPIRWLLCLYNDQTVEFDIEGIKSSNVTRGHRFLGSDNIVVNSFDEYKALLRENYVILDQNERKEMIKSQCMDVASSLNGNLLMDEDLLEEITYILEYPTAFYGQFNEDYLHLPKEVIITPMKEHQRYFPVEKDGKLLPNFITVRNGTKNKIEVVKAGNEKVLEARLSDALFFYNEDIKKPVETYVEKLKGIVFQEKLGTIYDKTERMVKLTDTLCDLFGYEKCNAVRTAQIAKADLVTNMVFEFTELQGVMGREYAKLSGENEVVSEAIFEHYLPRFAGDILPTTKEGTVVSIADKMDSICGFFAINIQPTGSQDPYALRRGALGIISIIIESGIKVSLKDIINKSLDNFNFLDFDKQKICSDVFEFFKQRIKNIFSDMNIRYDVIDAVLSTDIDDICDMKLRAMELNEWINNQEIVDILTAFNRVSNLASKVNKLDIDEDLLCAGEEINLFNKFVTVKNIVDDLIESKQYSKALDEFISLKGDIDSMFENVMIMDKDESIKNNRLALIKNISIQMNKICDLSKIVYK